MEIYALIAFAILLIFIGQKTASAQTSDAFHVEGKNVGLNKIVFGIFSVIGGGEFIYMSSLSYSFGIGSVLLFLSAALGAFILAKMIPNIRKFNAEGLKDKELEIFSIPDLAYVYNGRKCAVLTFVYTLGALGSLLLIQYAIGGEVLGILTGIPYEYSVGIMAVTICIYVYRGGFNSILVTDIIQIVSLFLIFGLIAFFMDSPVESPKEVMSLSSLPDWSTSLLLFFGGLAFFLGGGDIWHRLLAADSDKTAQKALYINIVLFLLFGALLAYIGTRFLGAFPEGSVYGDTTIIADNSFFVLLKTLPDFLKVIIALGLFAGLVSSSDTELHTISTLLNKEMSRGSQKEIPLNRTRKIIILVTAVSAFLAIVLKDSLVDVYLVLLNFFIILMGFTIPTALGYGKPVITFISLCLSGIILSYLVVTGAINDGVNAVFVGLPTLIGGFLGGRANVVVGKAN